MSRPSSPSGLRGAIEKQENVPANARIREGSYHAISTSNAARYVVQGDRGDELLYAVSAARIVALSAMSPLRWMVMPSSTVHVPFSLPGLDLLP